MTDKPPPYSAAGMPMPPPPYSRPPFDVPPVTVVNVIHQWSPYPMQVLCPCCSAQVITETSSSPGFLTWLLAGTCVFLGCWLGCCLIPCCIPECQDVIHSCPGCKTHLGTYRRI